MPCYEPSGPDIDLAYEKAETQRLKKLLALSCDLLVISGCGHLIDKNPDLKHWYDLYRSSYFRQIEQDVRETLAKAATEKPFKDLTLEEKKLLKEFNYL